MMAGERDSAVTITVRPARASDRELIVENMLAMARETEGIELDRGKLEHGVAAALADPALGRYFIADVEMGTADADAEAPEAGREPAGSLMVTREWSDWRGAYYFWIQSVYVAPKYRRLGVYRALHERVIELARAEGAFEVRLYVHRDNAGARKTYLKAGMIKSDYVMYEVEVYDEDEGV